MVILQSRGDYKMVNVSIWIKVRNDGSIIADIGCYGFPNFSHNLMAGYAVCNHLNDDTVVKFYIDDEGDAVAEMTMVFNGYGYETGFSGEAVLIEALKIAGNFDDAFEAFNDAL